jgi:hypothetical protein
MDIKIIPAITAPFDILDLMSHRIIRACLDEFCRSSDLPNIGCLLKSLRLRLMGKKTSLIAAHLLLAPTGGDSCFLRDAIQR